MGGVGPSNLLLLSVNGGMLLGGLFAPFILSGGQKSVVGKVVQVLVLFVGGLVSGGVAGFAVFWAGTLFLPREVLFQ